MPSPQENFSLISIEWWLFSANFFDAYPIHGRTKLVHLVCTTPVRFDNKLKKNLRKQLWGEFYVFPLRAKALLAGYVSASRRACRPGRASLMHLVCKRLRKLASSPRLKHMISEANKDNPSRERVFCHYLTASARNEREKTVKCLPKANKHWSSRFDNLIHYSEIWNKNNCTLTMRSKQNE